LSVLSGMTTHGGGDSPQALVMYLRELAIDALVRMYRPDQRLYGWCLRRSGEGIVLEGVSRRYTATVLLSLAGESEAVVSRVLHGQSVGEVCEHLVDGIQGGDDLGEVALTLWAARALGHGGADAALGRLRLLDPVNGSWPTVEVAWALMALSVEGGGSTDEAVARSLAARLLTAFNRRSGLFSHWPGGVAGSGWRGHVTCFADFVYPVQALSHYYRMTGCVEAIEVARRCAERMCGLQGAAGQWWWHFDVRTGRVLERFPVYSVHQDSMAPMALFALRGAGGDDCMDAVVRGLSWLVEPPEIEGSLVDGKDKVIWRKIARREPGKLVRGLQAGVSRLRESWRVPGVDLAFRPGAIDWESRPYHMGWILYTWNDERTRALPAAGTG
jgi:hypothetical protein